MQKLLWLNAPVQREAKTAVAKGGSPSSEAAIERGLLWLARHQAAKRILGI